MEHLLAQFRMRQQDVPLVSAECITLNSDWRSKEEVLKGMTDNLLLAGRCRYPRKLEADLWAREAVFSTGLGFSFAIPHSKSEHIEQSTIRVARLAQPVIWGDEEAQFVIMLTLNKHSAGDQHMRIFSRLARPHYARGVPSISGIRGEQRGYCRPAAPRAGTVIVSPASAAGRRASYKSSTNRPPLAREQQISILCWLAFSSSL
ncbi:PTS system phosphoenolpyruvate-protein phosphotransferase [Klebsiella pneumoniae]|uniref:PTS system phosphoenolpyruvate-protein phosphotransferase n=1 Tax=Klebsiella pneumoniae TaxID=573 RepID=A0A378F6U1_KLEPN|nr:PTS system phosphoenolpyruvate-protein phosphotransferase [Klebsiella pneumoniae]